MTDIKKPRLRGLIIQNSKLLRVCGCSDIVSVRADESSILSSIAKCNPHLLNVVLCRPISSALVCLLAVMGFTTATITLGRLEAFKRGRVYSRDGLTPRTGRYTYWNRAG